jgi:hypothetical protein
MDNIILPLKGGIAIGVWCMWLIKQDNLSRLVYWIALNQRRTDNTMVKKIPKG